jgi:hypothetical protein
MKSEAMVCEIPTPESHEVKEVYAFYGLAAYCGQVLEKGVINLLTSSHLKNIVITRKQYDGIVAKYKKKTLGGLLRDVQSMIDLPEATADVLTSALSKRNWLVHHYFYDRVPAFMTEIGRKDMINELQESTKLFQIADELTKQIYMPIFEQAGITEESLKREAEAMTDEFLESKRVD